MSDTEAEIAFEDRTSGYAVEFRAKSGGWINALNRLDLTLESARLVYSDLIEPEGSPFFSKTAFSPEDVRLVQVATITRGIVRNDLLEVKD